MRRTFKQLSPNLAIDKIDDNDDAFYVHCHLKNKFSICPKCGNKISSIHSIHTRKIQDLPIQCKTVFLLVNVRHFNCIKCKYIYTEELEFASKTSHKTKRLLDLILNNSCSISSITSQYSLNKQWIIVKKSTICTYQKKRYSNNWFFESNYSWYWWFCY